MKSELFKKHKAIAYLRSPYAVLQYLLLRPYGIEETLFFLDDSSQEDLISRLPHYYSFNMQPTKLRILPYIIRVWHCLILYFLSWRLHVVFLSSRHVYRDQCLYYFRHIIYLEDGTSSYLVKTAKMQSNADSVKDKLRRILFGPSYPALGWADKVEKIYLTGILPIPEGIVAKVELINLRELWDKRSPVEKQEIIRLFLSKGIEFVPSQPVPVLLLTQPLSEDLGVGFTEEEKIEVYRELLSGIDEKNVLIKSHPREQTDYRKHFPQATVLDTYCPMELLVIMGMQVKKAITVNSTAIYSLDDSVEKVIAINHPSSKIKKVVTLLWGEAFLAEHSQSIRK